MKKFKVTLASKRRREIVKGDYIRVEQGCLIVRIQNPNTYPTTAKMYAAGHWVSVEEVS